MIKSFLERKGGITIRIGDYITTNTNICHGQPCFKGTRVMVYLILELLEAGYTPEQIIRSYPSLTKQHIKASLHFAAEMIKTEEYSSFVVKS